MTASLSREGNVSHLESSDFMDWLRHAGCSSGTCWTSIVSTSQPQSRHHQGNWWKAENGVNRGTRMLVRGYFKKRNPKSILTDQWPAQAAILSSDSWALVEYSPSMITFWPKTKISGPKKSVHLCTLTMFWPPPEKVVQRKKLPFPK